MQPKVLCVLAPGFEEIETVTPIDLLRRAEVDVVIASLNGESLVEGRSGISVKADRPLDGIDAVGFDCLFIPGGPGVKGIREDGRVAALARQMAGAGKLLSAICAAPTVLADAGLLEGRRFTAHFSVHNELPAALGGERVVEDGSVITSRGAGTAVDFGLALVRRLRGANKADEIASAIMA